MQIYNVSLSPKFFFLAIIFKQVERWLYARGVALTFLSKRKRIHPQFEKAKGPMTHAREIGEQPVAWRCLVQRLGEA
jgi:hypothetical protein